MRTSEGDKTSSLNKSQLRAKHDDFDSRADSRHCAGPNSWSEYEMSCERLRGVLASGASSGSSVEVLPRDRGLIRAVGGGCPAVWSTVAQFPLKETPKGPVADLT